MKIRINTMSTYNLPVNKPLRISGDLNLPAISDNKELSHDDSKVIESSSNIPFHVVRKDLNPVFGSIAVHDSENVQFGNNTIINGPVTIKQIIQTHAGVENQGYVKTENGEDEAKKESRKEVEVDSNSFLSSLRNLCTPIWMKIIIPVIGVAIVAVVYVIIINDHKDESYTQNIGYSFKENQSYFLVVGLLSYKYQMIVMVIVISILISLCISSVNKTTLKSSVGGKREPPHEASSLLIAPERELKIVPRSDWLAQPPNGEMDLLTHPVPWVIIAHTASENCRSQSECVYRVRIIQDFHVESKKFADIGYNFLVGGDGSAYYGRGWDYSGAHTKTFNIKSIGIAFIGTFTMKPPPKQQLDACKKLIELGVKIGKLDKNYKLFAHRQLTSTASPGDKLFEILKEWPHFVKNVDGEIDGLTLEPVEKV